MTVFIGPTILLTCALLFLPYWIVIQVQFLTHRSNYDTWNKWQILFIGTYVVMLVASTLGFVAAFVKSRMLYVVATAVAAVSLLAQIGTEVRLFLYDHHEWPSGNWAWLWQVLPGMVSQVIVVLAGVGCMAFHCTSRYWHRTEYHPLN